MSTEAPLLANEADHPQEVVEEHGDRRIVVMDSARYVDARNRGTDVVVPASYLGVLPARHMAPHRPRAVIGHDGAIGMDDAGIAGLEIVERHGLAGGSFDAWTAPIGDAFKAYEIGKVGACNRLAAARGVEVGMAVSDAALALLLHED